MISTLRSRTQMPSTPSLVGTSRGGPLPIEEVTRDTLDASEQQAAES